MLQWNTILKAKKEKEELTLCNCTLLGTVHYAEDGPVTVILFSAYNTISSRN